MRKLNLKPLDAMLLRMLNRSWVTDRDVARILRCHPKHAFDKLREVARRRKLCAVCIVTANHQKMIVVKPCTEETISKFVTILPP